MSARTVEIASLAAMAVAVLVGGRELLTSIARLHGTAISALVVIAIVVVYAFRRNFLQGGPRARISASRDTAFIAAIAAAIAFIASPARWSLGSAVAALEIGIVVELISRIAPVPEAPLPGRSELQETP